MSEVFEKYAQKMRETKVKMSNFQKGTVYGLFKQVKEGDNTAEKPGFLSIEARNKWKAWELQKGKTTEEAEAEYIKMCQGFVGEL